MLLRISRLCAVLWMASAVWSWQHVFMDGESDDCHESCFTTTMGAYQTVRPPIWFSTSPRDSFERSKMSGVNSTAWEHWYFEAVSPAGDVFLTSFARDPSYKLFGKGVLRLELRFSWANGTSHGAVEFVDQSTVQDCCGAVSGSWTVKDKSFSFLVSADLKTATVSIRSPTITGQVELKSIAPARYPDGETWPSRSASTQLSPHLHFTEAIMAARATVDFDVLGSRLKFTGLGGHNHFWAAFDWFTIVQGWRVSRGVAGPYAFVIWHPISNWGQDKGVEYQSAMLLRDGRPVFTSSGAPEKKNSSTKENHVVLRRKYGDGVQSAFIDKSIGWTIDFVAPKDSERWSFELDHQTVAMDIAFGNASAATYFTEAVKGGRRQGDEAYTGYAISEQTYFPQTVTLDFMYQVWAYFLAETQSSVAGSLWSTSSTIFRDLVSTVGWRLV